MELPKEPPQRKRHSIISRWYEPIPTMYPLASYPLPPKKLETFDLTRMGSTFSRTSSPGRRDSIRSSSKRKLFDAQSPNRLSRTLSRQKEYSEPLSGGLLLTPPTARRELADAFDPRKRSLLREWSLLKTSSDGKSRTGGRSDSMNDTV